MERDVEFHRVCPSLLTWHRYSGEVKADLFSTAVLVNGRGYLVDPIGTASDQLRSALAGSAIAGVVVTNENHARAANEFAAAFSAPVFAHAETQRALELPAATIVHHGEQFAPGLTAIVIEGAPAGEIAIHAAPDGGSLIIGDALINMGSYGFTFLPAKYCTNHKQMRRSLEKLLDWDFERMVFAHGLPIVARAKEQLAQLFASDK